MYIYIYIERERDRYKHIDIYIYIYIYPSVEKKFLALTRASAALASYWVPACRHSEFTGALSRAYERAITE